MKNIIRFASLYAYLLLLSVPSQANNIMASDIGWQCIGKDSFLVTLTVYRDCNGDALMPVDLHLECHNTGTALSVVKFTPGTPVDVTPVCNISCTRCQDPQCSFPYGIHRLRMHSIINISNAGGCCRIRLRWEKCCRNLSITTGAAGKNFYTEAILDRCTVPCDNSPQMNYTLPVGILCAGFEYQFHLDPQDYDIDSIGYPLDSFSFAFAPPLQADADSITYDTPYASTKPIYFDGFPDNKLSFPRGFQIADHGILQLKPMKPEVTVFAIIVKEYRKGKLIGEIRREMQYMVVTCQTNHRPFLTTIDSVRSKSVCEGNTVTFNFTTNDSDIYDSLRISWNNSLPGASWLNTNKKEKHPTASLTWTPSEGYGRSIPYTFTVTVKDDAHPVRGFYTQTYQINVMPKPQAKIIITDSCCFSYWLMAQRISGSAPKYEWEGKDFTFSPKIGSVTYKRFAQFGVYPFKVTMTDMHGCSQTYYDSIVNYPLKASLPADTAVCKDDIVNLNLNLYPPPHNFYIEWRLGSEIIKSETNTSISIKVISDTTVIGYASISEGCTCMGTADTINIKVLNCTSISEQGTDHQISISPNPAIDQFIISTKQKNIPIQSVLIYNCQGMLVQNFKNIVSDKLIVQRNSENIGLYFIRIVLENQQVINTKIILQ